MRRLIAAVLLALATTAYADCRDDLQAMVDAMLPSTSDIAGAPISARIVMVPELRTTDESLAALALTRRHEIAIAQTQVCAYTEASRRGLLAHELGHMVAHRMLPVLEEDAYRPNPQLGAMLHEAIADDYAGRILSRMGWLDDVVSELAKRCIPQDSTFESFGRHASVTACHHLNAMQAVSLR